MPAFNTDLYLQQHPDLRQNWERANDPNWLAQNPNDPNVGYIQQFGSLEDYATDHYNKVPEARQAYERAYGPVIETGAGGFQGQNGGGSSGGPVTPVGNNPLSNIQYHPVEASGGNGGNYNQTQNSAQGGQFQTTGQQATNQTQSGEQHATGFNDSQQQQTGTNSQTGTQSQVADTNQQQTSHTGTTGTNTTNVNDTLGFGKLLQGQVGTTQANDAARNTFLTDMVNTGGSAMNSQVDQAVRNSLTGPGMTGAGDSARARAAGYAGAQIARQNTDQRLAAAQQLSGPSALTNLVGAGDPYLGKTENVNQSSDMTGNTTGKTTTSGTTSSQGTSNMTGNTQNQTGQDSTSLSKLIGNTEEVNTGATNAQSSQNAFGQIPEGKPVQAGGGCVLCTAAIHLGLSRHHLILRRVIDHKLHKDWSSFRLAARGYFFLFTPLARWFLSHPRLAATFWPMAKAVLYEELRVSGRKLPVRNWAYTVHWVGHWACALVGLLPVPGVVTNQTILKIARDNNILFEVKS